jgi:hypothetical protein
MKSLKNKLKERIHYFDLDDTLFHHGGRTSIILTRRGETKRMSTKDWTGFARQKGDKLDYSEFRSSHHFAQSAQPIQKVIQKLKKSSRLSKTEILTGRSDLDDREHFGQTLASHGIDYKKVHVRRVGNMRDSNTTAQRKAIHISNAINNNGYKDVHLYDDSIDNLNAFLDLKNKHPDVKFTAYHVNHHDGKTKIKRHKK